MLTFATPFLLSMHAEMLNSQLSIEQEEGDLSKLDYRARLSLAILLDQNEDWRRLGRLMNLASLEGGFATFTSPTKDLLSMYQVRGLNMTRVL